MDCSRTSSRQSLTPKATVTALEAAKAALPIFGGTGQTPETESPPEQTASSQTSQTSQSSSGGDSQSSETPKEVTPEQLSDLLRQVTELNSTVTTLKSENDGYKQKEEQARRTAQSREETLTEDLDRAQQTISQMDSVIKHLAVVNAIQGNQEFQFHDPRDVISRLDESEYDLEIDLESGKAGVKDLNNALKRIAKESPWLVKSRASDESNERQAPRPPARGSGAPPANPGSGGNKSSRREALIDRFPVISHGRRL